MPVYYSNLSRNLTLLSTSICLFFVADHATQNLQPQLHLSRLYLHDILPLLTKFYLLLIDEGLHGPVISSLKIFRHVRQLGTVDLTGVCAMRHMEANRR